MSLFLSPRIFPFPTVKSSTTYDAMMTPEGKSRNRCTSIGIFGLVQDLSCMGRTGFFPIVDIFLDGLLICGAVVDMHYCMLPWMKNQRFLQYFPMDCGNVQFIHNSPHGSIVGCVWHIRISYWRMFFFSSVCVCFMRSHICFFLTNYANKIDQILQSTSYQFVSHPLHQTIPSPTHSFRIQLNRSHQIQLCHQLP